jgi:hypothetical protein
MHQRRPDPSSIQPSAASDLRHLPTFTRHRSRPLANRDRSPGCNEAEMIFSIFGSRSEIMPSPPIWTSALRIGAQDGPHRDLQTMAKKRLSDLTDRNAVLEALREYDKRGQVTCKVPLRPWQPLRKLNDPWPGPPAGRIARRGASAATARRSKVARMRGTSRQALLSAKTLRCV